MKSVENSVLMTCPLVGEGNPAMMFAQANLFRADGINVDTSLLTASSLAARIFHKRMSGSPEFSKSYSQNGEGLRGMAKLILGIPMAAELVLRNNALATPGAEYNFLVGTQEHQFGALKKEFLKEKFPQGRVLVVGDVEPKQSAIDIAQNKGIRLAVWNIQAFERLEDLGLDPMLVGPSLPLGFFPDGLPKVNKMEHVLVKSSGSGMPESYTQKIKAALESWGVPYKIFLPDKVLTESGETMRPKKLVDKVLEYYDEIVNNPPALTICYPSEQVQSEASQGRVFLSLPPRGPHEVTNLKWAKKHGVLLDMVDPENDKDLERKLFVDYFVARNITISTDGLGMGEANLSSYVNLGKDSVKTQELVAV